MDVSQGFEHALAAGDAAALPLALLGGILTGMNPCCLALYPAAAGACCSWQRGTVRRPIGKAVAFLLGIAVAVAALGVLAAYLGRVAVLATPLRYGIAFLPILVGADRLGWIRLPWPTPPASGTGMRSAFGTGLLLALVIGPCGTPVLASVLTFAAYRQNIAYGALLLFVYGVGSGLPVALAGSAAGGFLQRIASSRFGAWIDPLLGGMLILLGFYLLWRV